ncbi:unnamed protein product [Rotaria sordida]|uniref:Integrase catalytic domain-containing protein n=1 Tax=Rotaria sordida TaxID=392033 RepID=A0A814PRQ5_9BILA|nr:unnamed protein product [Rotaria sordida]CAF1166107.1 unnamed protein product [Rotaria sordida]CAF3539846.1 unnamed protein product [Rotaria sordida]CAF3548302.1 unnamed protein product [Rotaria sordida]
MHNPSTKATIDALSSLFTLYGLCEIILSDNGTQFTSTEFTEYCARNGSQVLQGSSRLKKRVKRLIEEIKNRRM